MGIKQDLSTYFNDHSFTKRARATAAREFEAMLDGVDERLSKVALHSLKRHHISFEDARGASFCGATCKIKAPFDSRKADTMWHEIGHAVDFIRANFIVDVDKSKSRYVPLNASSTVVLSGGKTLEATIREELKERGQWIYDEIIARLRREALDLIGDGVGDEYFRANEELKRNAHNRRKYRIGQYNAFNMTKEERDRVVAEFRAHTLTIPEENALVDFINRTNEAPEMRAFFKRYNTVMDAVSGIVDTKHVFPGHSRAYMKGNGFFGTELFAGLFSSEAVGNELNHSTVSELLPRSYAAYRELRDLIFAD